MWGMCTIVFFCVCGEGIVRCVGAVLGSIVCNFDLRKGDLLFVYSVGVIVLHLGRWWCV